MSVNVHIYVYMYGTQAATRETAVNTMMVDANDCCAMRIPHAWVNK